MYMNAHIQKFAGTNYKICKRLYPSQTHVTEEVSKVYYISCRNGAVVTMLHLYVALSFN